MGKNPALIPIVLGNLNGISEISSWRAVGVDNAALVWLTFTSLIFFAGPAIFSLFYIEIKNRTTQNLRPIIPDEQIEEHKNAA